MQRALEALACGVDVHSMEKVRVPFRWLVGWIVGKRWATVAQPCTVLPLQLSEA